MDIIDFQTLLTPVGQEALSSAEAMSPREIDYLRHFTSLSRRYPSNLARAALETAILRAEAAVKFPAADKMYFSRQALEQASNAEVSSYRAKRFRDYSKVVDLGCSIGGDTLSLARVAPTLGVDLDPLRLAMAQSNLEVLDLRGLVSFIRSNLLSPLPLTPVPSLALFFDPARRVHGRRVFSVHQYSPPLELIHNWLPYFPALGVKISPGVRIHELSTFDSELEFISLRGELKEAVLWFGPFMTTRRRATVLPGEHTLSDENESESQRLPPSLSEPIDYLYEPDPSILRAGLVRKLGSQLNAHQLDPDIAYLTAEKLIHTPFARAWEVEAWFPFGLKRLRAALRERCVGRVVVKKRGSPLQPEALIRDLRLKGDEERIVFLTHLRGRPIVVLCYPN